MSIESQDDFDGIVRAGRAVARVLKAMVSAVQIGTTTRDLDDIGASELKQQGARSAPRAFYGCPSDNLISVNDAIVHGLPGRHTLRAGDVVKVDVTAELDGYIADAATTVVLPGGHANGERLRACAVAAFDAGLAAASAGRRVAEIGRAVEREVTSHGFAVLRELSGHGVGRRIHEEPTVANYYDPFQRDVLTEGLVLTIEPLISERRTRIVQDEDGWTLRTRNGCLAAHYEHTLIITNGTPLIVTRDA
jgi:methionyl aminopeptidase